MPTAKDTRVRGRRLVEDDGDGAAGPASGWAANGSALSAIGQVEDLGLLGGGQVVVAQEVRGSCGVPPSWLAASRSAGSAARNVVDLRGGERRAAGRAGCASGVAGVDDEPGVAGPRAATAAATRSRERDGPEQARAADPGDAAGGRAPATPPARCSPSAVARARAGRPSRSRRARRGRRRRRAGCRRRSCRAARLRAGRPTLGPEGHQRADRDAAAEALGQGDDVGHDAGLLVGEPGAGAADAGLHLVEHEQRAVRRVVSSRAAAGSPGRRHDHAGLALDRLEDDRGRRRRSTAARSAATSPYGTWVDVAGQRLERLAVGRLARSARARPSCGRGRRPRRRRCRVRPVRRVSLNAASLASVPELVKNTAEPGGAPASASSRSASATCGGVAKKFETWPRVASCAVTAATQRGVARGRAR